ncbi:MAG: hypothetical protein AABZ06_09810 [Bdellovibrionota bacterium]
MAEDIQSKAAEMMKKVLTVGVGAAFLTEESLRNLVSEFKLPKEILSTILESANKTRKEFLQGLSRDVISRLFDKIDPVALLEDFLSKHDVNLQVKLNFSKKTPAGKSSRVDSAPDQPES